MASSSSTRRMVLSQKKKKKKLICICKDLDLRTCRGTNKLMKWGRMEKNSCLTEIHTFLQKSEQSTNEKDNVVKFCQEFRGFGQNLDQLCKDQQSCVDCRVQQGSIEILHLPAVVEISNGLLHLSEGTQSLLLSQFHQLQLLLQLSYINFIRQRAVPLQYTDNIPLSTILPYQLVLKSGDRIQFFFPIQFKIFFHLSLVHAQAISAVSSPLVI